MIPALHWYYSVLRGSNNQYIGRLIMNYEHTDSREINALGDVNDFRHLMNDGFIQSVDSSPCYRITAIPFDLNPNAISLNDPNIKQLLFNPTHEHLRGFGVRGFLERETSQELNGIKGRNIGLDHGEIILQWNGYLEYRCPIFNSYFFWGKKLPQYADFEDLNWLYPLVVCEHPVSFLRLVRELYAAAGITCPFVVMQEYHNLLWLSLPAGSPDFLSLVFCLDGAHRCGSWEPIVSDTKVYHPNFNPDQTAYGLLKSVYAAFELSERDIPFFDESGNFSRDNNYRQSYRKTFN